MKARTMTSLGCALGMAVMSSAAIAQYEADFENPPFVGDADGELLSGQDGWYLPSGVDMLVYTYAGNVLGVANHPTDGGEQFTAGEGPGDGSNYARGQRDENWSASNGWKYRYDVCPLYLLDPPATNNLGSFSLQPSSASASYIHIFTYVDINDPSLGWQAGYMAYTDTGSQEGAPGHIPGPEWTNLPLNHWYRFETEIDFGSNRILEVTIEDLTTGATASHSPLGWYLRGGAGGDVRPTGYRFFCGGGGPGNVVAWDNLQIDTVAGLTISTDDDCPGTMTIDAQGGEADGRIAFAYSFRAGSWTVPGGPCAGLELGIVQPTVAAIVRSDGNGRASVTGNVPPAACGRIHVQAVDIGPCAASNVLSL